ncbi:MAG: hypothetical protein JNK60_07675 [Acidobacteria bacterium]|nr:hypothetical protein [Acidobacteriota bacterium]
MNDTMSTSKRSITAVRSLEPGDGQEGMEQLKLLDGDISHEDWLTEWGDESVHRYAEFLESGEKAMTIEQVFALARAGIP